MLVTVCAECRHVHVGRVCECGCDDWSKLVGVLDSTPPPSREPGPVTDAEAEEEWVPIAGYEGLYSVSSAGRVRSKITTEHRRKGVLKPLLDRYGYQSVKLWRQGVCTRAKIHILVAAAFIGPRPPGLVLNHLDGTKTRNVPSTLEYVTRARNNQHASEIGLARAPRGEDHGRAKITAATAAIIRESPESHRVLGQRYGVSRGHVYRIKKGLAWA